MATIDVLSLEKKKVGQVELSAEVFESDVRKDILHAVVRWQLAKKRQGTHQTKTRAYVSGGGKKPFKQKGTGNARQGTSRSPLMPGGAILFGPQPRDYSYTLPKKTKQLGLKSALSLLHKEGRLFVVDALDSNGKTNALSKTLKKFGVKKAVLLDAKSNETFLRACKNMKEYTYYSVDGLNVYDLLKFDHLILAKGSLAGIEAKCGVGGQK